MKQIPHIDLEGCKVLTPLEMNKIHIETGLHTPVVRQSAAITATDASPAGSTPVRPH
ncbi:MAG: hypothetical protein K2K40_08665 [Paramuribaculum sp.]|nr:hypothetical protein [Paramuribaculum sp.]